MLDSLYKIFYSNPTAHNSEYLTRFSSPSAVHLPLEIKQFNHEKAFQAFFFYHQDLAILVEKIYVQFSDFFKILHRITPIVQQQFALSSLIDEVHSTSSIEGIHSTHRELKDILEGSSNRKHFSTIIKKYDLLVSGCSPIFHSCKDVRTFYDEFAHADAVADNPFLEKKL